MNPTNNNFNHIRQSYLQGYQAGKQLTRSNLFSKDNLPPLAVNDHLFKRENKLAQLHQPVIAEHNLGEKIRVEKKKIFDKLPQLNKHKPIFAYSKPEMFAGVRVEQLPHHHEQGLKVQGVPMPLQRRNKFVEDKPVGVHKVRTSSLNHPSGDQGVASPKSSPKKAQRQQSTGQQLRHIGDVHDLTSPEINSASSLSKTQLYQISTLNCKIEKPRQKLNKQISETLRPEQGGLMSDSKRQERAAKLQ